MEKITDRLAQTLHGLVRRFEDDPAVSGLPEFGLMRRAFRDQRETAGGEDGSGPKARLKPPKQETPPPCKTPRIPTAGTMSTRGRAARRSSTRTRRIRTGMARGS
jgi:hypothetical protein